MTNTPPRGRPSRPPRGRVSERARVHDDATIAPRARVNGRARVYGRARLDDDAEVTGTARVFGAARLRGTARIAGAVDIIGDDVEISDVEIDGDATDGSAIVITDGARITGPADIVILEVPGDPIVWCAHRIADGSWVGNAGCVHAVPWPFHIDLRRTEYGPARLGDLRQAALAELRRRVAAADPTLDPDPPLSGRPAFVQPTHITNGARPERATR